MTAYRHQGPEPRHRSEVTANLGPTLRVWVPAQPRTTLEKRLSATYWRITFLGRRVVNYKSFYNPKGDLNGVLAYTTQLPISPCTQHWLFRKGFPVEDARCDWDTCMTCYPPFKVKVEKW